MESEWNAISLREAGVSLIDCDHRTPPAAETGYPYIAIPQLKEGRIDLSDVRRISPGHFTEWTRKAKPQHHDVILSRRCNPGETAYVPVGLDCALGQNLVLLRSDGTKLFPPFLRWLVRGTHWWEQVGTFLNVGAVFDSLKCSDIPNFKLPLPPLPEQKAIAAILGALDDKIELNRRMNATLEAMARALFQSWFVDFDPVRAKMDGRQPSGLDSATTDLFPDRLEDSPLGHIPQGWEVSTIGEFARNHDGQRIPVKESERVPGPFPYYGASGIVDHISDSIFNGEYLLVAEDGENLRTQKTPIVFLATGRFWVNNHAHVLSGSDVGVTRFLMFVLRSADIGAYLTGSTIPKLSQGNLNRIKFLKPPDSILRAFGDSISGMFDRIHANERESRTLAALRDTLLPKLLSGEVRVGS